MSIVLTYKLTAACVFRSCLHAIFNSIVKYIRAYCVNPMNLNVLSVGGLAINKLVWFLCRCPVNYFTTVQFFFFYSFLNHFIHH